MTRPKPATPRETLAQNDGHREKRGGQVNNSKTRAATTRVAAAQKNEQKFESIFVCAAGGAAIGSLGGAWGVAVGCLLGAVLAAANVARTS